MIGNDVIDLALAKKESDWRRPGFLDKIFTSSEQQLIGNAPNPELAVWHLWSCKEAVYKIINRQYGLRAFIPLKIECLLEEDVVTYFENQYFTHSEISNDRIHTIAVAHREDFAKVASVSPDEIHKTNGIPYYKNTPASVSHHGRFTETIALGYSPSLDLSLRKSKASVYASSADEMRSAGVML